MNSEIIDASLLISKIHKKSISLEECIGNSPFVNLSVHQEATNLKESVDKLELGMSEIQERMTRLKTALSSTVVIPPILSTDDDVSLAFLIAVNGPIIDWSFAEAILKRYLFLGTENLDTNDDSDIDTDEDSDSFDADFRGYVWNGNDFDSSVATLLNGGDCWRVRKSLELLVKIVDDQSDFTTCIELFEALALMILKRKLSPLEDEEVKWAYLIANNQAKTIDHGILRWINSFLYSQKEKNNIVLNAIRIMYTLFNDEYCKSLMSTLNTIRMYNQYDANKINDSLIIISSICCNEENIPRFITAGLVMAMVNIFHSPMRTGNAFKRIVEKLCAYDEDIVQQFHLLGIPEGSDFFDV